MGSKKKDLEIIYNLQWKNKSFNGDDKANIVGMYDIPSTTLNWDIFKSYLLKNSGTTGDDVKVSYIASDDKEVPIESQSDFQIALYTFRKKARNGEIITLTLDRMSNKISCPKYVRHLDVQTQVHTDAFECKEFDSLSSDMPPEWFTQYMIKLKNEIIDEVTASITNSLNQVRINQPVIQSAYHHCRKSKADSKRTRKCVEANEKDLLKSMKLERKLENKLEKLERKTLKVKEKRLALARSSDSDAGRSANKCRAVPVAVPVDISEQHMDAAPVNPHNTVVPHMMGGEIYMQKWEVTNTGKLPWTADTELHYAWGSQALSPVSKAVPCPRLNPGETGPVNVLLEVPKIPGHYECYWHFHHNGRRFGHWLGCQVIVDPSPVKAENFGFLEPEREILPYLKNRRPKLEESEHSEKETFVYGDYANEEEVKKLNNEEEEAATMQNISASLEKLTINIPADDTNCSSDSDNQSIISIADSNTSLTSESGEEFVIVPSNAEENVKEEPKEDETVVVKQEPQEIVANDDNNNDPEQINGEVLKTEVSNENPGTSAAANDVKQETGQDHNKKTGYAFVVIDGNKVAVPKKFLHDEFLATAEDAPDPNTTIWFTPDQISKPELPKIDTEPKSASADEFTNVKSGDCASHCSTMGTCFSDAPEVGDEASSRLFVFPQSCPGFEVVHPHNVNIEESFIANVEKPNGGEGFVPTAPNEMASLMSNSAVSCPSTNNYNWQASTSQYVYSNAANPTLARYDPYALENVRPAYFNQNIPVYPNLQANNIYSTSQSHYSLLNGQDASQIIAAQQNSSSDVSPMGTTATYDAARMCASSPASDHAMTAEQRQGGVSQTVHMIPETLVTGAVNVASSAINTARSVLNMLAPARGEAGTWVNGRWITINPDSKRETALNLLDEMGFKNRDYNASLLNRYDDDVEKVLSDLLTIK